MIVKNLSNSVKLCDCKLHARCRADAQINNFAACRLHKLISE